MTEEDTGICEDMLTFRMYLYKNVNQIHASNFMLAKLFLTFQEEFFFKIPITNQQTSIII